MRQYCLGDFGSLIDWTLKRQHLHPLYQCTINQSWSSLRLLGISSRGLSSRLRDLATRGSWAWNWWCRPAQTGDCSTTSEFFFQPIIQFFIELIAILYIQFLQFYGVYKQQREKTKKIRQHYKKTTSVCLSRHHLYIKKTYFCFKLLLIWDRH